MRISTTMIMNSYAENLNDKYESINKYSNQLSTTMAYQRGSENPVAAMQTIKSCTQYTINQQNQTNQEMASSWMAATESTLTAVNKIVTTAYEKAEQAANGTNSASDYGNYSVAFKSYREELVSTLNTSYDGQYIFGESSDGNAPFKLGTAADGKNKAGDSNEGQLMYYNYNSKTPGYIPVSDIEKTIATTASGNTTGPDYTYTKSGSSVTDDLTLTTPVSVGTDKDFETATSGLDVIISSFASTMTPTTTTIGGTAATLTGSTHSGNIVDQLTSVINQLTTNPSNPDLSGLSGLITDTTNAQDAILKVKVNVGEKSNMLNQISSRLTDNEANLTSALANSMEVDSTQAIMKYNMAETIYKESMSIASTVLQCSLFDYLK